MQTSHLSFFVAGLFALALPAPALAIYDMSGQWGLSVQDVHLDLIQSSGALTSGPRTTVPLGGTIDEGTGEFHLFSPPLGFPFCGAWTLEGNVAADSMSFVGTVRYGLIEGPVPHLIHCQPYEIPAVGSRCGNGDIDPGEECDDANPRDGDCCSSSCIYDAVGATCTTDNQVCTDDVCDGAGTCNHPQNTAPCASPDACTVGSCSAGSCVLTMPAIAGAPCNADYSLCTSDDACDGAGNCEPGAALECSPCEQCYAYAGCIAGPPSTCDFDPASLSMDMEIAEDSSKDRLSLKIADDVALADLGHPTSDTDYTLCVYAVEYDFLPTYEVLLEFDFAAGGTCETGDCWKDASSGFTYKDRAGSVGGISSLVARTNGFRMKGRGDALPLPAAFPLSPLGIEPYLIASDGVTTKCWSGSANTAIQTETEFKLRYRR